MEGDESEGGGDPPRTISPELEGDVASSEGDDDREFDQAEDVAAPAVTLPAALTALGLAARRGDNDTWKEIEVWRQRG
jgi:hypothetical protein